MNRIAIAFTLLFAVLATLSVPAVAQPIDQEGWAARKQRVTLANGVTLAYVELGDPAAARCCCSTAIPTPAGSGPCWRRSFAATG